MEPACRRPLEPMLQKARNITALRFFVMAALVIELLYTLATPPLQAPDEFSHFYRAYQVSDGNFLPVKHDQRLGGYIPEGIHDFINQYRQPAYIYNYTFTYREIARSFKIKLQRDSVTFRDFANTAYYSPVSYLPHALVLAVLKPFNCPPAILYYAGRLFVFVLWLLAMRWVIKTVPVFKWLFTFLVLLPMNPYVVNSFSADTVTNILSFLFIALALKHMFVSKTVAGRQLLVLALLLVLLALAKVVYVGLIVLLFAIPGHKFKNKIYRFASLGALLGISFVVALLWQTAVMQLYIPFKDYNPNYQAVACLSPCGDYYAQKAYIMQHGTYFFKVIWHSLFDHPRTYLSGYVGLFGNSDISLPLWAYVITYIGIVFIAFTEKNRFGFLGRQKIWLFAAAAAAFVLLLLSQHLVWDCVGEGVVDLLQGRYLIPLLPLVFMLFSGSVVNARFNPGVVVGVVLIMLYGFSIYRIHHRFFTGPAAQKSEVYCNTEDVNGQGAFITSYPNALMSDAESRSALEHRSGGTCALLTPDRPFCFTHKFKGLHKGDLLEAEAWQKGSGGLLVFSGKKESCGDFYFAGTFKGHCDKQGWQRLRNIYELSLDCDSAEIAFYAWNPGQQLVYLDDIKLTVTHFNPPPSQK